MRQRQKLRHLQAWQVFEAAARLLSFVRAAQELGVTPAAVSQHIKTLEDHTGVRLFHRSTHSVSLTDEGMAVLPGVSDGFATLARSIARLEAREFENVVRVSVPPSFASRWLLQRLHRFIRKHPGYTPSVDATASLVDFDMQPVDVAVRFGKGVYPGLSSKLLFEEHVFPVCSPSLLERPDGRLPLQALAGMPLIHDTLGGTDALPTWVQWLEQHHMTHPHAEGGGMHLSSALAVEAAVEGNGVVLGRGVIVADDLALGRLVRPFAETAKLDAAYYLVHRPVEEMPRKLQAFREWILDEARQSVEAMLFDEGEALAA